MAATLITKLYQCKEGFQLCAAAEKVARSRNSPTEGDDLEERITRVVMRVMREKSAEAGQHAASSDGPGPSHVVEGRRNTGGN